MSARGAAPFPLPCVARFCPADAWGGVCARADGACPPFSPGPGPRHSPSRRPRRRPRGRRRPPRSPRRRSLGGCTAMGSVAPGLLPAAVRCDMVLHQSFRAGHVRKDGIGGEVRHGVTSGVWCETSSIERVPPHLHREYLARETGSVRFSGRGRPRVWDFPLESGISFWKQEFPLE